LGKNIKKWAFSHIKKFYLISAYALINRLRAHLHVPEAITDENVALRVLLGFLLVYFQKN